MKWWKLIFLGAAGLLIAIGLNLPYPTKTYRLLFPNDGTIASIEASYFSTTGGCLTFYKYTTPVYTGLPVAAFCVPVATVLSGTEFQVVSQDRTF